MFAFFIVGCVGLCFGTMPLHNPLKHYFFELMTQREKTIAFLEQKFAEYGNRFVFRGTTHERFRKYNTEIMLIDTMHDHDDDARYQIVEKMKEWFNYKLILIYTVPDTEKKCGLGFAESIRFSFLFEDEQ